jgi:adenine/guanine phosphoribosyltransferase-like PRPP-binding protein
MLPLIQGRRVALVDDVISSGASMEAALRLMALCGVEPLVLGAAMLQSDRWIARLGAPWSARTVAVLRTPILSRTANGWAAP